jgi:hypothetical protein
MNSRFIILVCCLLGITIVGQAQNFVVIHTTSQAKELTTGKKLELGQSLSETEKINLGDRYGRVVLWNKEKGVKLLIAKELEGNKWKTAGTLDELNQPLPTKPLMSYREHFASMADLATHFSGRKYLILGKTWLVADAPYHITGDTVLFFKYERPKADIEVNRKVERRGDSLLLDPKFILDMNGTPVPADDARNFQLYWLDKKTKGYQELARFDFVFVEEEVLRKEVGVLIVQLLTVKSDIRPTVEQFLIAAYGIPDDHNLDEWLRRYFP